jgi:hypothetical protein
MSVMKLLNIRLGPSDVARVRALRARGVKLSHLVREAIRAEHDRRTRLTPRNVVQTLAELYAQHPVALERERQRFDVHHRRRFRKAIEHHVRRRMGR